MHTRTLMAVLIAALLAGAPVASAQAASSRSAAGPRADAAQPLCGGNGTKTPPGEPAPPPKEPPKT